MLEHYYLPKYAWYQETMNGNPRARINSRDYKLRTSLSTRTVEMNSTAIEEKRE
jgi:hypothetical protein